LRRHRVRPPRDLAGYVRLICDSLGRGHAEAVHQFERMTGRTFQRLLMTGGGSKNPLLGQATADAVGRPVISLDLEGSAVGNLASELVALGEVETLARFRQHLAQQLRPRVFTPRS